MAAKRKKASEATASRTAHAAPAVEGIAFGAASGALALGVAEQAAAARAEEAIAAAAMKKDARKDDAADPADAAPVVAHHPNQTGQSTRVVTESDSVPAPESAAGPAVAADGDRHASTVAAAPEGGRAEPEARQAEKPVAADQAPPTGQVPEGTTAPEETAAEMTPAEKDGAAWSQPSEAVALPDSAALAARVSDQIIGAIDTMAQRIAAGAPTADIGRSFASEILDAATGMVREIELAVPKGEEIAGKAKSTIDETLDSLSLDGTLSELTDTTDQIADIATDTASSLLATLPTQSTIDETLDSLPLDGTLSDLTGTTDQIAELTDTADEMAETATDTASSLIATLPTKLLGAETDEADGGVLSELFYSDGDASGPAIGGLASDVLPAADPLRTPEAMDGPALLPDIGSDLSDTAATIVEGFDPLPVTLAGVSYLDGNDMPYSGMQSSLGALHVV